MPFIDNILQHRSLSIVGLDKNTGKTVCLNYILNRLRELNVPCAVTSIGIDGEQTDQVFGSAKPEITLYEGMKFITSEKHYHQRLLVSRILHVDTQRTSLGRLVTGEVLCSGKILLSGAATTEKLKEQIAVFQSLGVPLSIVDGALSRLSLASPTVTESMILATGAAVSVNVQQLISKTRYTCRLIAAPEVSPQEREALKGIQSGLWALDEDGVAHDLEIKSVFLLGNDSRDLFRYGKRIFVSGAVSDKLMRYLSAQKQISEVTLIVKDFTKMFVSQEVYAEFVRKGGSLKVLQQSKLMAICFNPTSPQGFTLPSEEVCERMSQALELPVYDVMKVKR